MSGCAKAYLEPPTRAGKYYTRWLSTVKGKEFHVDDENSEVEPEIREKENILQPASVYDRSIYCPEIMLGILFTWQV